MQNYQPKYPVQTVEKALDIITYLKNNPSAEGVSISELSERLKLGKSSVHRILDTLLSYNFVEKSNSGLSYYLGWGLFDAGNVVPMQHSLSSAKYVPLLESICDEFEETVNLGVLNQYEVVIIYKTEPNVRIRVNMQVGGREPLNATSLGKIFMSQFTNDEICRYLEASKPEKLTPNTIVSADQMISEIEKVRKCGYSVDNEEFYEGLICTAMPVYDYSGKIVAAISVSGPSKRIDENKLKMIRSRLSSVCLELSAYMGHNPDSHLNK